MNPQQHQQFLQRMTMQQQQQQMIIAAARNQSQSSSSTTPGTFQYISQDELLSLYEQRKGAQYFIPEGFEPVLIPRDTSIPPINNNNIDNNDNNNNRLPLLQQQQKIKKVIGKNNNKINNNVNMTMRDIAVSNNSSSTNTTKTINNNKQSPINSSASSSPSLSSSTTTTTATSTSSDVRFPKLVLSRTTATQQTPRAGAAANNNNNNNNSKPIKQKKPPRPPNAFIIYRRFKQPDIVAKNEGITNNEVSKQVGEMWHREPMEEKLRFQRMADDAKMEHMKKYPEYKYRPRRPHEKRRRTKRPQSSSNGVVNNNNNNADVVADSSSTTDSNNNNNINNNNNTNNNNELLIFQPHLHNDHNDIDRRASIDTVSTTETCLDYFGADESRRGSIISLNDFDYGNDFDPLFNDDTHGLLAEEQLTTITSSSSSPSPDLQFNVLSGNNNICVGSNNNSFNTTDALDFLMENVNTPDFSKPDFQFDFFINNFTTTTTANNNNNNNNNNPNDTFDFFDLSGFSLNDSLLMPCDQSIHGDLI